jgi:cytochrome c oxidase subunit III
MSASNLNVAHLPDHASGSRALLWWGTMGFIAVELSIFGVLIATYLYGMARADVWPPGGEPPDLTYGIATTAIMLLSVWPNLLYQRAAGRSDVRLLRRGLVVAVVLETALIAVRCFEFFALEVRWDEHFYGSILWTMLAFHTLHLVSDWIETIALLLIARREPLNPRRVADMGENALYWHFAVLIWLPIFVLIYLVPRFLS